MDEYFYILTAIDVMVLLFMCMMVNASENLRDRQKRGFLVTFTLIIVISVLEVISVVAEEKPVGWRWVTILSNYLGFLLTPLTPLCFVHILDAQEHQKKIRAAAGVIWFGYAAFITASLPFGTIFRVEPDNRYFRGDFFQIYVTFYFAGIVYLALATMLSSAHHQNRSRILVFPLMSFLLLGVIVQLAFPQIRTTWLSMTMMSVLYYIYCSEMWNQLDGLTGLLNQASYLNRTAAHRRGDELLIVFDVDRFKQVNDTCGHLFGDQCLREIADCIKKAYSGSGSCYRIGGDEFCVILQDSSRERACAEALCRCLEKKRIANPKLPTVSYGSAAIAAGENILTTKERADQNMYQYKKAHRSQESEREKQEKPEPAV